MRQELFSLDLIKPQTASNPVSTTYNIMWVVDTVADITNNLDKEKQTEACFLDFSKAFDKVNHTKFIPKLSDKGVTYQVSAWVKAFLHGRS